MNININTFNEWAKSNKDKKMADGHYSSVMLMIAMINENSSILDKRFSFLDIGCGNGWVVREFLNNNLCINATGIDGAKNMINKANSYNLGQFLNKDIEHYNFNKKFDIVFSMETFYYFSNPNKIINSIYQNGIKKNGLFIIGLDHYKENKSTLSWGKDYNLHLNTLSSNEWINMFENAGFKKIIYKNVNADKDWQGTLVILGVK